MAQNPAYARIAFYTARPDADLDAVLARAKDELVPMMQAQPGFRRYTVLRTGPDTIASISGWDDREQAESVAQNVSSWVREVMGPSLASMENHIAEVISITEASAAPAVYGRVLDTRFQSAMVDEVSARAQTDYLPLLQQQPGFIRHVAFRAGPDRAITFASFGSREQLAAAEAATRSWREYVMSQAASSDRHVGEVAWGVRKD